MAYYRGAAPLPPRQAFCILQHPSVGGVVEALVALASVGAEPTAKSVVGWTTVREGSEGGLG